MNPLMAITTLCLVLLSGHSMIQAQKVGNQCTDASNCTTTKETCPASGGKCECAENYLNAGSKTCVPAACTAGGNECDAIPNTTCVSDQCTCAEGYELETAAGETKDSCKASGGGDSGAAGVIVSMVLVGVCIIAGVLNY